MRVVRPVRSHVARRPGLAGWGSARTPYGPPRGRIRRPTTDRRTTMSADWKFETQQIHAGQVPDPATGARALPIYQTTSFVFESAEQAANRFALTDLGPIYTRITNPTQEAVENRIAALEGGVGALLLASGQAAETFAILNIAEAGDHVVASPSLYGGTYNLLRYSLPKLGIETTFVDDPHDLEQWRAAVRPNTKLFFAESIPNPKSDVLNIEGVAAAAHEAGVPLVVDNTIATPYLINPLAWGADVVVHSATKYLGGHGTSIAGVIVDGGTFDYAQYPERFPGFNTPDPSYNGLVYARDLGVNGILGANLAYILKARVQLLRDLGAAVSPFNAFLIAQGIETLSLRVERHVANASTVATWLEGRDDVLSVSYSGLESSPWHANQVKYAPKGGGAVLALEIAGGAEAGKAFVSALELHSNVANIGDVRSLVIHPASTTHSQLSPEAQLGAGVAPGLVRLAVGLEHIDDILADLEKGFAAVAALSGGDGESAEGASE
ncbi:bifunctional o-acetylhomoserine/o-acetylserine sulfhydrylase [Salana multivorans]